MIKGKSENEKGTNHAYIGNIISMKVYYIHKFNLPEA